MNNFNKSNKDQIVENFKEILENYNLLQNQYIGENKYLITLFNNFKALIKVYENKLETDSKLANDLLAIIKKSKENMLPTHKLKELENRHAEILIEFNQLKKGLIQLDNLDLNSIIENMRLSGNLKTDNFNSIENVKKNLNSIENNKVNKHNNLDNIFGDNIKHKNLNLQESYNNLYNINKENNSDNGTENNTDNNSNIAVKGHFKERSIRNKKRETEPYVYIKPYKRKKTKKINERERLKKLIHKIQKKK